jgi:hypothetical protein
MVINIFIDESGYTGEDLLNIDQPIFVLASTILDNNLCNEIFSEIFPNFKGKELKHSKLRSRLIGQNRIITLIRTLKNYNSLNTLFIVHKEFTLITKLVDLWVEPAMYKDGYDLYDRGGNISLSNLTYNVLRSLLPKNVFSDILTRFQAMMRYRTYKSYKYFWNPTI